LDFIRIKVGGQLPCQHKEIVRKSVQVFDYILIDGFNVIKMHRQTLGTPANATGNMTV
jgi:UDP-N-acetyl-D-mannosaminuronic acid transferase (WecB/TagA/CpsF family)